MKILVNLIAKANLKFSGLYIFFFYKVGLFELLVVKPARDQTTGCFAQALDSRCLESTGWTGDTCEVELESQCLSEPCEHNGTCQGDRASFQCHCPEGWTGSHCEVNINECASNPCLNGLCVDKDAGYQCFCKPGMYDPLSQNKLNQQRRALQEERLISSVSPLA